MRPGLWNSRIMVSSWCPTILPSFVRARSISTMSAPWPTAVRKASAVFSITLEENFPRWHAICTCLHRGSHRISIFFFQSLISRFVLSHIPLCFNPYFTALSIAPWTKYF